MIRKFKLQELTGLNLADAVVLVQDLVDIETRNLAELKRFSQTKKRALFLPHCARKHMDNQCKATFDKAVPTYVCAHCSPDCLINQATQLAQQRGYDVYVLPGGSCIPKILKEKGYDGAVGVGCGMEIKLGGEVFNQLGVSGQAVPLLKNGCTGTTFNLETLTKLLQPLKK